MKKLLFILLCSILYASPAMAGCSGSSPTWTCTADSTVAQINTTIGSATAGDTINIGAGSATWSDYVLVTKAVSIIGSGVGVTVITRGSAANPFFAIDPADYSDTSNLYRISGFTLDNNNLDCGSYASMIVIGTNYKTWASDAPNLPKVRIDHNTFQNADVAGCQAIWNFATMSGVVDNNTFTAIRYPVRTDNAYIGATETKARQFLTNAQPHMTLGSSYKLYFEDNTFSGMFDGSSASIVADCNVGGTYAFRYNTITLGYEGQPLFDAHGYYGFNAVGCVSTEIYGNKIDGSGSTNPGNLSTLRGGSNAVFGNSFIHASAGNGTAYYQEQCATGADEFPVQIIHDSYTFLNRQNANGTLLGTSNLGNNLSCNGLTGVPSEGQDFFDDSDNGVRYGTLANIPATCTVGQGYWATDQTTPLSNLTAYVGASTTHPSGTRTPANVFAGSLYKCTATNQWGGATPAVFYTPYTYPHPLRYTDETAPSVAITTADPSTIAVDSLAISGTATDLIGVSSCKWRLGAAPNAGAGTALTGTTSWSGTVTGFAEGSNTLYAGCTDAAGNWGSDSITVTYTPAPPATGFSLIIGVTGGVVGTQQTGGMVVP